MQQKTLDIDQEQWHYIGNVIEQVIDIRTTQTY